MRIYAESRRTRQFRGKRVTASNRRRTRSPRSFLGLYSQPEPNEKRNWIWSAVWRGRDKCPAAAEYVERETRFLAFRTGVFLRRSAVPSFDRKRGIRLPRKRASERSLRAACGFHDYACRLRESQSRNHRLARRNRESRDVV